jgi:uncharacterized protein
MAQAGKAAHGQALPATIDPIQLAERGAHLIGTLPLKGMRRLMQTALAGSADVAVDLAFERGEGDNVLLMHGRLRTRLRVQCQRCLEPMDLDLESEPWLVLLRPDARHVFRQEEEPDTLVVDKPLALITLVEDELLLSLPMVPMHALPVCPARHLVQPVPKPSPFAALKRRGS